MTGECLRIKGTPYLSCTLRSGGVSDVGGEKVAAVLGGADGVQTEKHILQSGAIFTRKIQKTQERAKRQNMGVGERPWKNLNPFSEHYG